MLLTIAFLIANLINNKNAINGIVNVVALGSSFLCGAFVPVEWLPNFVLKLHIYYHHIGIYKQNEIVKTLETINFETLKPVMINMGVILFIFSWFYSINKYYFKEKEKNSIM